MKALIVLKNTRKGEFSMCGIAGIVSSYHRELGFLLEEMLRSMQHRGPDGAGFVIGDSCERQLKMQDLDFKGKKGQVALGHVRLAITGSLDGMQPFQSDDGRLTLLHNGEIYNYKKFAKELGNQVNLTTVSDSEVLLKYIEKNYNGDLLETVGKILPDLDGVYALALTDQKQTIIARDKIGVRQLYYYRGGNYVAFASEKKPLLALGGDESHINRLLPSHIMLIRNGSLAPKRFWDPIRIRENGHIENPDEAIKQYDSAIRESIAKRLENWDHVGIIFSGGIDSVLIAYLAKELGLSFGCYTAGKKGAIDIEWARKVADRFKFPLMVKELSDEEIEELIPQVIKDIEDHSLNQVEVSIPMFASIRMAQESGERVILTGQGADELFGGYPWYAKIVDQEGYDSFVGYSWEDTMLLYKECLEREDKIAMAHSLELRVPYLDPRVIQAAFNISPKLKIKPKNDHLLKRIHRKYCLSIGIPGDIVIRKKEAAQHGANVHDVFEKLAGKTGVTDADLIKAGYDINKSVLERLGSSSRYGFRYGDHHLWKPLLNVQYYLDTQAAGINMLPKKSRKHWQEVTNRLETAGVI